MQTSLQRRGNIPAGKQTGFGIVPLDKYQPGALSDHPILTSIDYYRIVWIQQGKGNYRINNTPVQPGWDHLYCFCPGQPITLVADSACTGLVIYFPEKFLTDHQDKNDILSSYQLYKNFKRQCSVPLPATTAAAMNNVLHLALAQDCSEGKPGIILAARYLKVFLLYLAEQQLKVPAITSHCTDASLSFKYLELVEVHFAVRKSVSEYAKYLYVTPNHLNKIVKDETGLTARQHIQQKIVAAAKRELNLHGISMKQVAAQLGFDDIAHFSKFFKKASGINFSCLKKNLSQHTGIA
jgi:AraC-like DNA-binding protein